MTTEFYAVRHRVDGNTPSWIKFDYREARYKFTYNTPSLYSSKEAAEAVITDLPKSTGYEVVKLVMEG